MVLAAASLTGPVMAQGIGGSDGEAFLMALKENEPRKALDLIEVGGSRVANYRGRDGDAALHIVTRARSNNWVGYLLQQGADPNIAGTNGDTPLIIAARLGFTEGAARLIGKKADLNKGNRFGETPLIVAVQQRQVPILRMLLAAGADPDKRDHAAGYSAREYAKRDSRNPELLRMIETIKSTKKKVLSGPKL